MNKIDLKCNSCNAPLNMSVDKLSLFCPYCGNKLMFYVDDINKILLEREKTKRAEIEMQKEKNKLDYLSEKNKQDAELIKNPLIWIFMILVVVAFIVMRIIG